jgi:energy-coupling factor transport system substrate-specific component
MNSVSSGQTEGSQTLNIIDILVLSVIGIVFGVLSAFWQTIYMGAGAVFGPLGSGIVAGFVCIPAILSAYIIRKPGAALLSEVISVFGQVIAGNPFGVVILVYGVAQGLPAEAVFFATKYKRWGWLTLLVAAALSQAGSWVASVWVFSFFTFSTALLIGVLIAQMISGVGLAGVVGKLIGDGLLRTGVLDSFAIAEDQRV